MVLDVDVNHASGKYGDETLSSLEEEYGPLPDTWTCLTGGGGMHYYFRCDDPDLTVAVGFLPGLDYRGTGGYVIAPPSIHPASGRRYEWEVNHLPEDIPLAPLPDWLHNLMESKHERKRISANPNKTDKNPTKEIPVGTRNDTLFRYGCSLRGKGATTEEIYAELQQKNADLCKPPLQRRKLLSLQRTLNGMNRGVFRRCCPVLFRRTIPTQAMQRYLRRYIKGICFGLMLWVGYSGTVNSGRETTTVP